MEVAGTFALRPKQKGGSPQQAAVNAPTPAGQAAQCLTVSESVRVADLVVPAWVYTDEPRSCRAPGDGHARA